MPPGAPRDNGPASSADGADAGSVVVGLDPSVPGGVALLSITVDMSRLVERLGAVTQGFQRMRDNLAQAADQEALRSFGENLRRPHTAGGAGAMRWTPPPEGEETRPCPA